MNRFLLTLVTTVVFALSSAAYAVDTKIGGLLEQIVGAGNNADGGVTDAFTRISAGGSTTTDNGWTVGGSFAIQYQAMNGGANAGYAPSGNSMYIATDVATVTIGNHMGVAGSTPGVSAMVPGGGIDAGYQFSFDGGNLGTNGVQGRAAYYAMATSGISVALPTVNGFTVKATYSPDMSKNSSSTGSRVQSAISTSHGEVAQLLATYTGETDGMSYTIGISHLAGNGQGASRSDNAAHSNSDLSAWDLGIKITMGDLTIGASGFDNGDSFGATTDADKASNSGYNFAATYAMGNVTIGAGYSHQEMVRGTNAQALATKLTSAAANNVREDNFTLLGIAYNMGGGVNTFLQLSNNDHSDGDHATTEADPTIVFAGITLGF